MLIFPFVLPMGFYFLNGDWFFFFFFWKNVIILICKLMAKLYFIVVGKQKYLLYFFLLELFIEVSKKKWLSRGLVKILNKLYRYINQKKHIMLIIILSTIFVGFNDNEDKVLVDIFLGDKHRANLFCIEIRENSRSNTLNHRDILFFFFYYCLIIWIIIL